MPLLQNSHERTLHTVPVPGSADEPGVKARLEALSSLFCARNIWLMIH